MILCIPGFLGTPKDFDWLTFPHVCLDLFQNEEIPEDLPKVGKYIVEYCKEKNIKKILGYSLGGRLLMHALCFDPEYFTEAFIVSAHTGLGSREERDLRNEKDAEWVRKFNELPWEAVLHEWNNQEVLQGRSEIREEKDYKLSLIIKALIHWSLGEQEDLLPQLSSVKTKTIFITGGKDPKFTGIASTASNTIKDARHIIIADSGHRLLLEASQSLSKIFNK